MNFIGNVSEERSYPRWFQEFLEGCNEWQQSTTYREQLQQYTSGRLDLLDRFRRADIQWCTPEAGVLYDPTTEDEPGDLECVAAQFVRWKRIAELNAEVNGPDRALAKDPCIGGTDQEMFDWEERNRLASQLSFEEAGDRWQLLTTMTGFLLRRSSFASAEQLLKRASTAEELMELLREEVGRRHPALGPEAFATIRTWAADVYLLGCPGELSNVRAEFLLDRADTTEGRVALLQGEEDVMRETFHLPFDTPPDDFLAVNQVKASH